MICQQCGTENANTRTLCIKCRTDLRSTVAQGVVTCKNHGVRKSTAVCQQCLRPICDECTVIQEGRILCLEDASLDVSVDEEDRIEHLSVGDPSVVLHAGFPTRIFSLLIDIVIVSVVGLLLWGGILLLAGLPSLAVVTASSGSGRALLFWAVYALLVFAYNVGFTAAEGQTWGKQIMSIAVVESDGTTPSLNTAAIRTLGSLISLVCLGAGYFAILKDPAKQAWHDRWANTYVISLDEATERL